MHILPALHCTHRGSGGTGLRLVVDRWRVAKCGMQVCRVGQASLKQWYIFVWFG